MCLYICIYDRPLTKRVFHTLAARYRPSILDDGSNDNGSRIGPAQTQWTNSLRPPRQAKKKQKSLLLATLPSALLIGIVCLYMPCDAADVTVATLACTPLAVWRSRSFLCLALGDAVLIVIDVFAIAYAPKHVSGSECALIGLLENILAPLWVSVWKSTSRCRVDGVGVDAAIQDERAINLMSTQVGLRTLRRRALGVDGRRRRAPPRDTNRARGRREGTGTGEPARRERIPYSE